MIGQNENKYASYEVVYDVDYTSYQLIYEIETSAYEQVELLQDDEITKFIDVDVQFSVVEEAFFNSDVNPALVLEDYETRLDRLHSALSNALERAWTRAAPSPILQPNPH
jgi:hypothetical protein